MRRIGCFLFLGAILSASARSSPHEFQVVSRIHENSFVSDAAWSPDGERFATLSHFGTDISVWTNNGVKLASFARPEGRGPNIGRCFAFLHDNVTLLAPGPSDPHIPTDLVLTPSIGLWDSSAGELLRSIAVKRIPEPAGFCALSSDGRLLALRARRPNGVVAILDTATWTSVNAFHVTAEVMPHRWSGYKPPPMTDVWVFSLAFAETNALFVGAPGAAFRLVVSSQSMPATCIAGDELGVLSITKATDAPQERPWNWIFNVLAYNQRKKILAIGLDPGVDVPEREAALRSEDKRVQEGTAFLRIWDPNKGSNLAYDTKTAIPVDIDWSASGEFLAVAARDHQLHIFRWDEGSLAEVFNYRAGDAIGFVRFSPVSDVLIAGEGDTVITISTK